MNFIRNWKKTNDECAPVAVFNACNIFGANLKRVHDFDNIKKLCCYVRGEGTNRDDYFPFVRTVFNSTYRVRPKLSDIDKALEEGHVVLVGFCWANGKERSGHAALIVGKTKKNYKTLNYFNGKTEQLVRRSKLATDLRPKRYPGYKHLIPSEALIIKGVKK